MKDDSERTQELVCGAKLRLVYVKGLENRFNAEKRCVVVFRPCVRQCGGAVSQTDAGK